MSFANIAQLSKSELAIIAKNINERISEEPDQYDLCTDEDLEIDSVPETYYLVSETEDLEINEGVFENIFKCGNCFEQFSDESKLMTHTNVQHCKELQWCRLCSKKFMHRQSLRRHISKFHNAPIKDYIEIICRICSKRFYCDQRFKNSLQNYQCQLCSGKKCEFCYNFYSLDKHMRTHVFQNHMADLINKTDKFMCKLCLQRLSSNPDFENHKEHDCRNKYQCQICSKEFLGEDEVKKHMRYCRRGDGQGSINDIQYVCYICKKDESTKYSKLSLYRINELHCKICTRKLIYDPKYKCQICYQEYIMEDNFRKHLAFHVRPQKYGCTFCDRKFNLVSSLITHLKVHSKPEIISSSSKIETKKKKHKCQFCRTSFTHTADLNIHLQTFHFYKEDIGDELTVG